MKKIVFKSKCGKVQSDIVRECTQEGESIEQMISRCVESNEPIESTAPMIYTEEADGVLPQYDPRTDKTDLALDAIDKYHKSEIARAQEAAKEESAKPQNGNGEE